MAAADKPIGEMVKSLKQDNSPSTDSANLSSSVGASLSDATSCISSTKAPCDTKEADLDQDPSVVEQPTYYPVNGFYGYYYPGCEMPYAEWSDQGSMLGADGMDMPRPVTQPENGSFLYYIPGFQPAYNSYTSYMPGTLAGVDGQFAGQQTYPPSPVTPQPACHVYFPPSTCYEPETMPAYGWEPSYWNFNGGNGFVGNFIGSTIKPKSSAKMQTSKPPLTSKGTTTGLKGSTPVLDLHSKIKIPNHCLKPLNKSSIPAKGYFPVMKLPGCRYQGKDGLLYPNHPVNNKANGRSWIDTEKKAQNKVNGFGDPDLLNEQNRGPRTNSKNTSISGTDPGVPATKMEDKPSSKTIVISRDDYNLVGFPTNYEQALFFVIKSYSEDDIHKSIKYNVWASTPNGNKRLDHAYQTAQEKMSDKGCKCPVFLFFSVNASGQFCGVAEMIGQVDFNKNMNFWHQDKWSGFFPVKWHFIKDVPNPQFRHIILQNNDNKPVTNSRDTQEVGFPQGSEMLNIFKSFSSKTSILDDFSFYENRQKVMQVKKMKMSAAPLEQLPPKVEEAAQVEESDVVKPIISGMEAINLGSVKTVENENLVTAVE